MPLCGRVRRLQPCHVPANAIQYAEGRSVPSLRYGIALVIGGRSRCRSEARPSANTSTRYSMRNMEDKDTLIPSSLRPQKLLMSVVLGLACLVCAFVAWFNNSNRLDLAINEMAWESARPAAYYMVVDENWIPKGHWLWAVSVRGERTTGARLLESRQLSSNWAVPSGPTVATVEKAFELGQSCAGDLLDCRLEFDPQYHYPRSVSYSDLFVVQVKAFILCGESTETCPSPEELPVE